MIKKLCTFSLSIIAVLLIVLISCSKQDPENPPAPTPSTVEVKSVSLNKSSADLSVGQSLTLVATVSPTNAPDKSVTWSSSNSEVASVSSGVVTAHKPGNATITVKTNSGGKTATCRVNVKDIVKVESVALNQSSVQMAEGDTVRLTATVSPSDATNTKVIWKSSNAAVATVNGGLVKAVSVGEAMIIVNTEDGGKADTCNVAVMAAEEFIHVTSIGFSMPSNSIGIGEKMTLEVEIQPENATNKNVTWRSSNPGVATIDANGTLTGVAYGETVISLIAEDGGLTAEAPLVVINKISITSITIENVPSFMRVGDLAYLYANVQPENATNKSVKWSSSNPAIATVTEWGEVSAKSIGETEITATAVDGGMKATCKIVVGIPVDWIELVDIRQELAVGDAYQCNVIVHPENATIRDLVWTSSDPNVATVDNNGLIRAMSPGHVDISISANNGMTGCGFGVTVVEKVPVTSVNIESVPKLIRVGDIAYLYANVQPENATNRNVTWSSSNPSVATVNDNGEVVALSNGETEITAIAVDGGMKATCKITVGVPIQWLDFTNFRNEFVVGEVFTYNVSFFPEDATFKELLWTSSNPEVVTVENGTLRAISVGEADVNVLTTDGWSGGYTHHVRVFSEYNPTGISLDNWNLEIKAGETAKLVATVHPEYATNKNVKWSTTDPKVAIVDNDGNVTAVAHGGCYISATTEVGGHRAECYVWVPYVPVTGVSLDKTTAEIYVDKSVQLVAKVEPSNASNKDIHWESTNSDIATVENGVVTGRNPGQVIINAYTSDGWFNAYCTVTVKPNKVTGISLSKTSVEMTQGDEITLVAKITPTNATNKNVIWSSSSDAATVANGVVKAVRAGEVTITAKTEDGGYTASCKLYIKAKNGVDVGEWGEGGNNTGEAE